MFKILKKIGNLLLDLIFPIECLNCRQEGDYFCNSCFRELKFNNKEYLEKALKNIKAPYLDKIYIAGDYEDKSLKKLITKYKYNFLKPLGNVLAKFLISFWDLEIKETETLNFKISKPQKNYIVIPIPLSKKRLDWRGFNQAEIIAREFSEHFKYELNLDLKRIKYKKPQAELSEKERLNNLKSAFSYLSDKNNKNILDGNTIILVDDVATTGATLNEAARTLKEAGATEIYGLVIAKG